MHCLSDRAIEKTDIKFDPNEPSLQTEIGGKTSSNTSSEKSVVVAYRVSPKTQQLRQHETDKVNSMVSCNQCHSRAPWQKKSN
jgi:hypothetical protein